MIVVLTGAPGAGKGTQADMLQARCGFRKISTGDALRKHVKLGTEIGKIAGAIMERGELVSDDVLFRVLKEELGTNTKEVVLLDGYPRNISQAETLATLASVHPVKAAIHLDVPREELVSRLSGRRVCGSCGATYHVDHEPPKAAGVCDRCGGAVTQRADDKPEAVSVRLEVYERNTRPVMDWYGSKGVLKKVDGLGETEDVFQRLKGVIDAC